MVMNQVSNCIVCTKILRGKQEKFCSVSCKNKITQSYEAQKKRGLKRKIDLISAFGGRCSICGYNDNLAALTFHHSEQGKEFKLDMRSLSNRTLSSVLAEAKKCTLLCHNCHAEVHNPKLDLASLLIKPAALTTELRAHK